MYRFPLPIFLCDWDSHALERVDEEEEIDLIWLYRTQRGREPLEHKERLGFGIVFSITNTTEFIENVQFLTGKAERCHVGEAFPQYLTGSPEISIKWVDESGMRLEEYNCSYNKSDEYGLYGLLVV